MERLMNKWKLYSNEHEERRYNSKFITKLCRNFRSHELIIELPNKLFYDGELIVSILHALWLALFRSVNAALSLHQEDYKEEWRLLGYYAVWLL
jgi:hypothetical protein